MISRLVVQTTNQSIDQGNHQTEGAMDVSLYSHYTDLVAFDGLIGEFSSEYLNFDVGVQLC